MKNAYQPASGDRTKLSFSDLQTLEEKVLPTARRWLDIPGLSRQGRSTLEYWGESAEAKQ